MELLNALRAEKARNDSLRAALKKLDEEMKEFKKRQNELTHGLKFSQMRELQV